MTRINADYSIDYSIVNTTVYYSIFILGLFCLCNCLALSVYHEKKKTHVFMRLTIYICRASDIYKNFTFDLI